MKIQAVINTKEATTFEIQEDERLASVLAEVSETTGEVTFQDEQGTLTPQDKNAFIKSYLAILQNLIRIVSTEEATGVAKLKNRWTKQCERVEAANGNFLQST